MQKNKDESASESSEEWQKVQYGAAELASRTFVIENKRFFINVVQYKLSRSIKIAKPAARGCRRRLIIPIGAAAKLCDCLDGFIKFFNEIVSGERPPQTSHDSDLKAEIVRFRFRCYYVKMRENARGLYLILKQGGFHSESGLPFQIAIPARGMVQLKNALSELVEEYGDGYLEDENVETKLPESQQLRIERKRFFFDVDRNECGTFLRISEVSSLTGMRKSIIVPRSGWFQMYKRLGEIINEDSKENGEKDRGKAGRKLDHGNAK